MGAAVLAAAGTIYEDVWEAAGSMVQHTARFEPNPANRVAYDRLYQAFLDQLRQRSYLAESEVTHG